MALALLVIGLPTRVSAQGPDSVTAVHTPVAGQAIQAPGAAQADQTVSLLVRLSLDIPVQVLARNISEDSVVVRDVDGRFVSVPPGGEVPVFEGTPGQGRAIALQLRGPDSGWKVKVDVRRLH